MIEFLRLILHIIASLFKPRTKLVAEILVLRQQLNVLRRQVSKRPQLSNTDRFLFVWLYRWFPSVLSAIAILRPETIIRWHRAGFQSYWRERSRKPVGRPRISAELRRNLIGAMSRANHLCRVGGVFLDLLPQPVDVRLKCVSGDLGIVAPDFLQQGLTRYRTLGGTIEISQDPGLLVREPDLAAVRIEQEPVCYLYLPAHAPARHPHDLIAVQPPIGAHGAEIRLRLQEIVDCPHETGETGIVRAVDKVRDGDQYNRHWNTHR
jgi:hypothetical protein